VAVVNIYLWSALGHTPDALKKSAVYLQYIHAMRHDAASALTMHYILAATTQTLKRKSTLCMTSSTLTTMKTGLTSCVKVTILERE